MAFYLQQIIAAQYAPNAQTTMFTQGGSTGTSTRIDALTVTNVDSVARTISINLVLSGGSASAANKTTSAQTIQPGQCWVSPNEVGKVLAPGDFISVVASAASALVISAGGIFQQ
jgi:hypothetical protein